MPADQSEEDGESAENDIRNRADQVFQVFDELIPVPESIPSPATASPVTTLMCIGPELAELIKLEISKGIDKEREEIFADAVKQTMRKMKHEGVASSAPQDNDAASEVSVNTAVPVPQDVDATSEASVNTVVTDSKWIHVDQTDEKAPTGLSEEVDASG